MIKKARQTKGYFGAHWAVNTPSLLLYATHWLDESTGELTKLNPSLKLYYTHRWDAFNTFTANGLPYRESTKRVGKLLGISEETITKTLNPLLKTMGLLEVSKTSAASDYLVHPVKLCKGFLLNENLESLVRPYESIFKAREVIKDNADVWEMVQVSQHNKEQAKKALSNTKDKVFLLTAKQKLELLQQGRKKDNE